MKFSVIDYRITQAEISPNVGSLSVLHMKSMPVICLTVVMWGNQIKKFLANDELNCCDGVTQIHYVSQNEDLKECSLFLINFNFYINVLYCGRLMLI